MPIGIYHTLSLLIMTPGWSGRSYDNSTAWFQAIPAMTHSCHKYACISHNSITTIGKRPLYTSNGDSAKNDLTSCFSSWKQDEKLLHGLLVQSPARWWKDPPMVETRSSMRGHHSENTLFQLDRRKCRELSDRSPFLVDEESHSFCMSHRKNRLCGRLIRR